MREDRLELVKKEIRSVIITYPKGIGLESFLRAYRQLVGVRLPTREFGYVTDIDFLQSVPDVVRIQIDKNGDYLLNCIADETTEHIKNLVEKQRTAKPKPQKYNKNVNIVKNHEFNAKPFVSASLRENLFKVLMDFPDGLNYHSLLLAYRKKFKRPLNLEFLSDNNHEKLEKLTIAVTELEVKIIDGATRLFYHPLVKRKNKTEFENSVHVEDLSCKKNVSNVQSPRDLKDSEISAIPQVIKKEFEKVMKLYPDGVLAKHFPYLYEKISGESFDLLDLGYNNFLELADASPNIFICVKSFESPNDWVLFHPCFSENAKHLEELNKQFEKSKEEKSICKNDTNVISTEIALPTLSYSAPQFPNDLNLSAYIPIFITAAFNPSCFWFKLKTENVVHRFRELEEDMQEFYHSSSADSLKISHTDINIGSICVVFHEDYWYRVTVTSSPIEDLVNVYFVDYGGWEKVHCSNLRYLKYSFITLPSQAFKAQLALVKPAKKAQTWSRRAEVRFLQLCIKFNIMAQIHLEVDDIVSVYLCDTSGKDDVHINDTLIDEGLAESCSADTFLFDVSDNSETGESVKAENCSHIANNDKYSSKSLLPQRLSLGEGYHIHLIFICKQAFVSAGDMCNLFWSNKSAEVLIERLEFQNAEVPIKIISRDENLDLFKKCENLSINGFQKGCNQQYSVTLYPLNQAIKILNCIGHPSITVRETINKVLEVLSRDFKELTVIDLCKKFENNQNVAKENKGVHDSYCLYDLKALFEAIKCKRMNLQANCNKGDIGNNLTELKKIEILSDRIEERIRFLKSVCCTYS